MKTDNNVSRVLHDDGVPLVLLGSSVENKLNANLLGLRRLAGDVSSWAARVAINDAFGAVVICQQPGEGNRLHYHLDADEMWVILEGAANYIVEGDNGEMFGMVAQTGDIIVVTAGRRHMITAVGEYPAVRLAVTKPNVEHTYAE